MSRITGLARLVRKEHGRVGGNANSFASTDRRVSSGPIALDYALGGGVRVGWITMFFGAKSGGKTTSAKRVAANFQKLCRNCFRPAHRDGWRVFHGVEIGDSNDWTTSGTEDANVWTRLQAHAHFEAIEGGPMEVCASHGDHVLYQNAEGTKYARIVRIPGDIEDVPPTEEELAEDPDALWSAKGWCDCVAVGAYKYVPPKQTSSEGKREYDKKIARLQTEMKLNSYEELIVAWQDNEGSFDKKWAEILGVNTKRLYLMRCTSAEEAIDVYSAVLLSGQCDVAIIDSIAQLVPNKEIESSMEEWQQGLQARLVNKAARKIVQAMNVSENAGRPLTQVWINQTREKIGIMYGDNSVKPGGKGQDFAIHAEIQFKGSKVLSIEDQYGAKDETLTVPLHETFFFKNTKNRTGGTRDVQWSYTQLMRANDRGGIGSIVEDEFVQKLVLRYLTEVDKKKNTYTIRGRVFESQKEIMEAIREDLPWRAQIRAELLTHMLESPSSAFVAQAKEAKG
jgi:RecA/RadA recombinase